jgi:hypothetical protein
MEAPINSIRNFKFDFGTKTTENEKVFEKFVRLLEKFSQSILSLEMMGTLAANQIARLLIVVKNCEELNLNKIKTDLEISSTLLMEKLKTITIHQSENLKILKFLQNSQHVLENLFLKNNQYSLEEFDFICKFLSSQKNIKSLELDLRNFNHTISCNFLGTNQLDSLKLTYDRLSMHETKTEENVTTILSGQTRLKKLEISFVSKNIFNAIRKMVQLKKFKFGNIATDVEIMGEKNETCPNLKFLQFNCCSNLRNIMLLASIFPNVNTLYFLKFSRSVWILRDIFNHFRKIEYLTVKNNCNKIIYSEIESVHTNLKEFTYNNIIRHNCASVFREKLPNLEKLAIQCTFLESLLSNLEKLLEPSSKIQFLFYKLSLETKTTLDANGLNFISQKKDLKFLYINIVVIENSGNFLRTLKSSFDIVEINQESGYFLLVKSNKILQQILSSHWNEHEFKTIQKFKDLKESRKQSYGYIPDSKELVSKDASDVDCQSEESDDEKWEDN